MMFRDRADAGRQLAKKLTRFATKSPVVLALLRGGLPVAIEIAEALHAPVDVVLVRKIGAPSQPELAIGAVADGPTPELVTNADVMAYFPNAEAYLREQMKVQLAEIERRRRLYLGERPRIEVTGKTAIVVDDGIATGATTRAALHSVRRQKPSRLILAVPVAPKAALDDLRGEADEVVCLSTPEPFHAIGLFYSDFRQVEDDEVLALLDRASPTDKRTAKSILSKSR